MNYENEGWKEAERTFGKLHALLRRRKEEAGEVIPDTTWVVKLIPINEREELVQSEIDLIDSFVDKDGFLGQSLPASVVIKIPTLATAFAVAEKMLGSYLQDRNRDITQPPEATLPVETAALKLVRFVGVKVSDRIDTTPTSLTAMKETLSEDRLRTKLCLLRLGDGIDLGVKHFGSRRKKEKVNVVKRQVDQFTAFYGDRRESISIEQLSTNQIVDRFFDDEYESEWKPNAVDRKKGRAKALVARKKATEVMRAEAIVTAKRNQRALHLRQLKSKLEELSPTLATGLEALLIDEDVSMGSFCDMFQSTFYEPYAEKVAVEINDKKDEFDVSLSGPDVSAVNHQLQLTMLELLNQMKDKMKDKPKRKRGAGQSTHLGKSGVTCGILIQRSNAEEEKKKLDSKKKTLSDELDKMKALLQKAKDLEEELPTSFWKQINLKGKKRETLARLFGVFKTGMKAQEVSDALKDLMLSKDMVESKMRELEESIAAKAIVVPGIIASVREQEDFLERTQNYAVNACEFGTNDDDAVLSDDDGDESDEEV